MTFTFFGYAFQRILLWYTMHGTVHYPTGISTRGLASFAFARHYSRNLGWFLFLFLLRCFSSEGSLRMTMYSSYGSIFWVWKVSPFGNLRILRLFAPPRSLSQLVTSFIGSQCQGILLVLFFAWTNSPFVFPQICSLHEFRKSVLFANCNTITCFTEKPFKFLI